MEMLDQWVGEYWLWFALAMVLLALEAFFGGFMFLAVSVGALVMGALSNLFPYVGLEVQLLFFLVIATVFVWMTRSYLEERDRKARLLQAGGAKQNYVGREFLLVSPISEGHTTINIDGTVWEVRGEDALAGTKVRIVAMGEGYFQVEKVTP